MIIIDNSIDHYPLLLDNNNDDVKEALHTSIMILIYSIMMMMESILILNHYMPQIVIWIWPSHDHDYGRNVPLKEIVSPFVMELHGDPMDTLLVKVH